MYNNKKDIEKGNVEMIAKIAERIKILRENKNMTQAELASKLGISRAGVNAWEMGVTVPSTRSVVELSFIFNVSTDYLLGVTETSTISVEGLSDREIASVIEIIQCYKLKNKNE